jgi:uncharacterized protein YegP (UPF0339 family)
MKFEIYKDKKSQFRVRLVAKNGNVICATEAYATKKSALKAIENIRSVSETTPVMEVAK